MKKFSLLPALLLFSSAGFSQAGALDTTFNTSGMATYEISYTGNDGIYGMVQQADGKIINAGFSDDNGNLNAFFQRVNEDGSIDSTFGVNGISLFDVGIGADDRLYDLVLQPDGKVIGVGTASDGSQSDVLVIRLKTNGEADETFGGTGIVRLDPSLGGDEVAYGVTLQADGRIVIAGIQDNQSQNDVLLMRLMPDGAADNSFDIDGSVTMDIHGYNDVLESVAMGPDGKIIAAGATYDGQSSNVLVMRFDSTGQPDSTFSTDGKFSADLELTQTDYAMDVAVYSNGKVLVAGYINPGGISDAFLMRLQANGIFDGTFGSSGRQSYDISGGDVDRLSQVEILPDGKILAGGFSHFGITANDFLLLRTESNGTADTSFNSGIGWAAFDAGGTSGDGMRCMAVQADGKYLLGGLAQNKTIMMRVIDHVDIPQVVTPSRQAGSFQVWPNPFNEQLSFEIPAGIQPEMSWELMTPEGKLLLSGNIANPLAGTIHTLQFGQSPVASGFYFLTLRSADQVWVRKLMSNQN